MKEVTNESIDKKYKVHCAACQRETNHLVRQSIDRSDWDERSEIAWASHFQIIQCQGCDTLSFCHLDTCTEYQHQIGEDEWDDGDIYHLYPPRSKASRAVKAFHSAHPSVRRIYRESIEAFNGELLTLCAAGLRSVIEGICAAEGILGGPVVEQRKGGKTVEVRKKNLEGKIGGLCEKGVLTKANASVLHEHRFLGNEAVHELNPPSLDELAVAIDVIELTLSTLYEIPEKGEAMKEKRILKTKMASKYKVVRRVM